jgi:hypothetical protein
MDTRSTDTREATAVDALTRRLRDSSAWAMASDGDRRSFARAVLRVRRRLNLGGLLRHRIEPESRMHEVHRADVEHRRTLMGTEVVRDDGWPTIALLAVVSGLILVGVAVPVANIVVLIVSRFGGRP